MVYQSRQLLFPDSTGFGKSNTGKGEATRENSFLRVLDSKMNTPGISASKKSNGDISKSGIKNPLRYNKTLNAISREGQASGSKDADNITGDSNTYPSGKSVLNEMADNIREDSNIKNAGESETSASEDAEQKKIEQLQSKMDEIIVLLQKLLFITQEMNMDKGSLNEVEEFLLRHGESTSAVELKQALESCLDELMRMAEDFGDTKTSETAVKFAEKLIKLLGDDFTDLFNGKNGEIVINSPDKLLITIEKMLYEAENAKMVISGGAADEIIVPAMEQQTAQSFSEEPEDSNSIEEASKQNSDSSFQEGNAPVKQEERQAESSLGDFPAREDKSAAITSRAVQSAANAKADYQDGFSAIGDLYAINDSVPASDEVVKEPVVLRSWVIEQFVEKADELVSENKSELVVQLKPESLGKISLRVIQERGEVTARFVAENEQVKSILESNMQLLRDSLQKNGVSVQSLSVSVGQRDSGEASGNDGEQRGENEINRHIPQVSSGVEPPRQMYSYNGFMDGFYERGESGINLTA